MDLVLLALATAVPFVFLVRSKLRSDRLMQQTRLDSTDSLIEANTTETGHSHAYFVTKDPQEYARIFLPDNKK